MREEAEAKKELRRNQNQQQERDEFEKGDHFDFEIRVIFAKSDQGGRCSGDGSIDLRGARQEFRGLNGAFGAPRDTQSPPNMTRMSWVWTRQIVRSHLTIRLREPLARRRVDRHTSARWFTGSDVVISHFNFSRKGTWRVVRVQTICGAEPAVDLTGSALDINSGPGDADFALRGVASNIRYATRSERRELQARQEPLSRPHATCAALIPISKSDAWWALAQDERRAIFEEQSRHHSIGLAALPEIARKLYHSRDIGDPFDFLTWFEYAPAHEPIFDRLVADLRATEEWRYVTREVDIRLQRTPA